MSFVLELRQQSSIRPPSQPPGRRPSRDRRNTISAWVSGYPPTNERRGSGNPMECFAESRPTAHLKLDATRQRCTHTRQTIPDAAGLDAVGMAPLTRIRHVRAGALHSVEEFPGVRSIEVPDDYRLQERRFKITQVHSMASAGLGFERLPVGNDAADLAAHVSQRSIAPDVAFRVLGVALDRHRPERIVGPYPPVRRHNEQLQLVALSGAVGNTRRTAPQWQEPCSDGVGRS